MKIDEAKLNTVLKSGEQPTLFYLHGKEIFLVKTYVDRIKGKFLADINDSFNFTKFEGSPSVDDIINAVDALPVFADKRVVYLSDFDIEKYDNDSVKQLVEFFSDIPSSTVVIIAYTGLTPDGKKAKTKKLMAAAESKGYLTEFDYLSPSRVAELIIKKFGRQGIQISRDNAIYIAEKTLQDLTLIGMEVEKLSAYVGKGGTVEKEAIDLLVTKQLDSGIYELAAAITQKNAKKSFLLLNDLIAEGYQAVVIFSALASTFIDFYYAKLGLSAGKDTASITNDFNYPKNRSWVIGKTMNSIRKLDIDYIRRCLNILNRCDLELKSSPVADHIIIEKGVADLLVLEGNGYINVKN